MAETVTLKTPRLLRGTHGWWYLGGRGLVRLNAASVDAAGNLRTEIASQLQESGLDGPAAPMPYALTVLTATTCNLGCGYCFQNVGPDPVGGTRPPRIGSVSLTRATARNILRFASARMAEAGLDKLHVHLFGGEPLLNPDGCRHLLDLAGGHGLSSARMTSNGTLLTRDIARDLAALGLTIVQITFDGNRAEHDLTRIRRSGGGTFDQILANMAAASEATDLHWDLRVNVSQRNFDGISGMLADIADRVDPARCHIGFKLVSDVGVGFGDAFRSGSDLVDTFVGWTVEAAELGFGIYQPKATEACQSCSLPDGRLGAVVNADGTLYSCWESAGKPGWEVGTTETGYLPADEVADRWVACGYENRNADAVAARRFRDAVDAQVLDYLFTSGRLGKREPAARS